MVRRFPTRKADVIALARSIINGISENPDDFPASLFDVAELEERLDIVSSKLDERRELEARLKAIILDEQQALSELKQTMRKLLNIAEGLYLKSNPAILDKLDWDKRISREYFPPAQVRDLRAVRISPGTIKLSWRAGKRTESVGRTRFYKIQRRINTAAGEHNSSYLSDSNWRIIETSFDKELILKRQPTGVELEFRVIAVNATGEATPSNTAAIVA